MQFHLNVYRATLEDAKGFVFFPKHLLSVDSFHEIYLGESPTPTAGSGDHSKDMLWCDHS